MAHLSGNPLRIFACSEPADAIHAGNFDVCFASNSIAPAIPPLGQHLQIPSVIYCQEPDRRLHEARLSRRRSGTDLRTRISRTAQLFREDWFRKAEQRDLAAFDGILVNSHFSRETLARLYDLPSTVCYLGIDTSLFSPTGRRSIDRIVGLGSIHQHKDLGLAIQAIACIPEPRRPQLVWIGNSAHLEYADMLRRLARTLGVQFTIHERLSDKEMVAELSKGAMLLYTSHLEPFGLAPLEANACGLPVVAVAEGGVRETIKHGVNGLLTGSRDPDESVIARPASRRSLQLIFRIALAESLDLFRELIDVLKTPID